MTALGAKNDCLPPSNFRERVAALTTAVSSRVCFYVGSMSMAKVKNGPAAACLPRSRHIHSPVLPVTSLEVPSRQFSPERRARRHDWGDVTPLSDSIPPPV
ncbi:hypothetical protein N7530_009862 [Penicillium desertorum]|uniref:Uncharacterized protein n=1 Tax=Penicillium desertorum TaxID=1303715 RepID=A0A9X0BII0_9EURO|nr:hypothetical protein N7530_009862 [Penicillium desertorum]